MLTAHGACAIIEHRHDHIGDAEVVETYGNGSDVDDGVHRSHFMEMHLLYGQAVSLALCLCDDLEYPDRHSLCPVGQCASVQYLHNVGQSPVLMTMAMGMAVAVRM